MSPENLRFSTQTEDRDWYYVGYSPPNEARPYSVINLSVIDPKDLDSIADAMESEAKLWLDRYHVPSIIMAFNDEGDAYNLANVRPNDYLLAWDDIDRVVLKWNIDWPNGFPGVKLSPNQLKEIFSDIPFKTGSVIQKEFHKQLARLRVGWWLVFVWAVVVPLIVAVVEWWSDLLGLLVLGYAFFKAIVEALRLTGHIPKSERQKRKEAEELRMRHHHYHCERNPEAFNQLKAENFRREARESTQKEALALKAKASE